EMQDVFWYIKEAIDAYFDRRPFQVTVRAGCIIGKKHEPRAHMHVIDAPIISIETDTSSFDTDFEDIDTGLPLPPQQMAAGSVKVADPDDLEVEEVEDDGSFEIDVDISAEAALDAFIDGKKRPTHLDD
ncbi:MAG: hypothetical protein ABI867_08755, partial [Kofleriaceae bacterium]